MDRNRVKVAAIASMLIGAFVLPFPATPAGLFLPAAAEDGAQELETPADPTAASALSEAAEKRCRYHGTKREGHDYVRGSLEACCESILSQASRRHVAELVWDGQTLRAATFWNLVCVDVLQPELDEKGAPAPGAPLKRKELRVIAGSNVPLRNGIALQWGPLPTAKGAAPLIYVLDGSDRKIVAFDSVFNGNVSPRFVQSGAEFKDTVDIALDGSRNEVIRISSEGRISVIAANADSRRFNKSENPSIKRVFRPEGTDNREFLSIAYIRLFDQLIALRQDQTLIVLDRDSSDRSWPVAGSVPVDSAGQAEFIRLLEEYPGRTPEEGKAVLGIFDSKAKLLDLSLQRASKAVGANPR